MNILIKTSTEFTSLNPVLGSRQPGIESDTNRFKVGNGTNAWSELSYIEFPIEFAVASGTDTYTIDLRGTYFDQFPLEIPLVYFNGLHVRVKFTNANTGASTLNINGLGAVAIKKSVSAALSSGDIISGGIYELVYDGTNFQMIGGSGGGGGAVWGAITGTLSDQTDLQTALNAKENISNKATDFSTVNNTLYPSVQAVQTAIAAAVTGLWDDRGNFDASVNSYPSTGGSGTAGAILKGDIWTISVAGTLPTGIAVTAGDTVRALVDTPGNTQANWAIAENNIGYVPENQANKDTDGTLAANSDVKYPSQKAVKTYTDTGLALKLALAGGSMSAAINEAKGADIASATTTDIGAATGNYVVVTGTTTITGLGTVQAGTRRIVNFSGILTLTHNATSLILPTSANITTAAGDTATFISLGSGNWVCTQYQRASGIFLASNIANGVTGTTQSANSGDAKVATDLYADISADDLDIQIYQALGSSFKAQTLRGGLMAVTNSANLVNQRVVITPVKVKYPQTISGVAWWQRAQGAYTANNYNGIAFCSQSGGTLTIRAISTNDGNIWKGATNTLQTKNFAASYAAAAGTYYIVFLSCWSAVTTTPTIGIGDTVVNAGLFSGDFTNSATLSGALTSQTNIGASSSVGDTLTLSSFSNTGAPHYLAAI